MNKFLFSASVALTSVSVALAAASDAPVIKTFTPTGEQSQVFQMSDNGKFGVGQDFFETAYTQPFVIDFDNNQVIELFDSSQKNTPGFATDVTDDGQIIAGGWNNNPAIYRMSTGKWEKMPVPPGFAYQEGHLTAITPDGKYAVGFFYMGVSVIEGVTSYIERSMLWDLTGPKPKYVDLPNVPTFNTYGMNADSVRFIDITPDGQNILGFVDFTAPMTAWTFMYNVPTQTVIPIGTEICDGNVVMPISADILAVDEGKFSRDGKKIGITFYDRNDNTAIAVYDIESGNFNIIPESNGRLFGDIDNNGVIYASTPDTSPVRNWGFFAQGYWFDFKQILKNEWGIDWQRDYLKDDLGLSGTATAVTGDGMELMSVQFNFRPSPVFKIAFDKPLNELALSLDPLAEHTVSPAEGSIFSTVRNININFDRDVEIIGERNCVVLRDAQGNDVYSSLAFATQAGSPNVAVVTFRNAVLEDGKTYTLVVPAGSIQIKGDPQRTNREITVTYKGRANVPVKPVQISPSNGTALPRLSMGTNPINIVFDAVLSPLDEGTIDLYNFRDDKWEFLTTLAADVTGNVMNVYPLGEVTLAKDIRYKVLFNKNCVGDLTGANGNEEFQVEYIGTFEPQIETDNGIVFKTSFDLDDFGINKMMLFDGDQNQPHPTVANWGFTSEYPWWTARDSEETDNQAAVSHSMYSPAGKSDDWMITPHLYIPDNRCRLSFKAQSYKKAAEDHLKVFVFTSDDVYVAPITANMIAKFKENAELVFDEILSPGASEELLEGDWTEYEVLLDKFAGKHVYIAFVNDNEDQSAVFVDDILVERDMDFSMGLKVETYLVDAEGADIAGRIEILTNNEYEGIELSLLDANDQEVDHISEPSTFVKGDIYNFRFPKQLPLNKAERNMFKVTAKVGNVNSSSSGTVTNLVFKPQRNIVIEEATGTKCGFCPLGHRALEVLDELYGNQVIPVAIHCYSGGSDFATDWTSAYGAAIGFPAAPLGAINRTGIWGPFALAADGATYSYNNLTDDPNSDTWFDVVSRMVSELTDAEIDIDKAVLDPVSKSISIETSMKYAFNNPNVNLNLHTMVLENGLRARQSSNIYLNPSEVLGPWGKGGEYGKDPVTFNFDHVARGFHGNSVYGVPGFFPREVEASQVYKSEYSFPIPSYLVDNNKAEAVVMLIDANSGVIINAARKEISVEGSGVDNIDFDSDFVGNVFSTTGILVLPNASKADLNTLAPGIYICNGRKLKI